jgi:hypothetical protein
MHQSNLFIKSICNGGAPTAEDKALQWLIEEDLQFWDISKVMEHCNSNQRHVPRYHW